MLQIDILLCFGSDLHGSRIWHFGGVQDVSLM
jgi:hypothetical protein